MQITFLARTEPETACDVILGETEWKRLWRAANRTTVEPAKPPTMAVTIKLISKLGGFLGAPSDGPPGLKVIWNGLNKLFILVAFRNFM